MKSHTLAENTKDMADKSDTPLEQIPTEKELAQIKLEIEKAGMSMNQVAEAVRVAPSKRSIIQMPKDILLKHNALVVHKISSFSSTQRRLIQQRVAYGVSKGRIKPEEVAEEVNNLNAFIQSEIHKELKNANI